MRCSTSPAHNQTEAGMTKVQWLPAATSRTSRCRADTVDVVISNCVINLSGDKPQVLREPARVLKPSGRFAVSDVIADPDMDDATRADMIAWTGCIAGALTEAEFRTALEAAGFEHIEVQPTHQVHEHASAAIIRARKPDACCDRDALASCCEPAAKADCCDTQHAAGSCGCQAPNA